MMTLLSSGASSAPLAEELRDYLNIFFSAIETLIAESKEKELCGIRSGRIADGGIEPAPGKKT